MSNEEGNVTGDQVGIPTADGVKNVHPEIVKDWREQAFEILRKEAGAKLDLKNLAEEVEEQVGIKKGVITKWFRAQYKAETKKTTELAKTFEALDAAVPPQVN